MDKYDVVSVIGEGSFGRVYKAKVLQTNEYVALKIILKKGRTEKEIVGLNQECDILRKLKHRNIIPMLDSFETNDEIVVITEFANRELYEMLGQEGFLQEEQVQQITCDLVSALFYLHSNRVLHRDLKPQNVLLDEHGVAKLCDFGFARCMGVSTHVLTSIKGTPLYMAPELIDGTPYDHTADLWSLGCIVYELLVGSPPFSTTSILQLVQLIQHEAIKWPDFISFNCRNFLQGLLQKQPEKRLTWSQILNHPFLKNGVLTVESSVNNPFTSDMTASQCLAKETQTQALLSRRVECKKLASHKKDSKQESFPQVKTSSCPSESILNQTDRIIPDKNKTLHSSLIVNPKSLDVSMKVFTGIENELNSLALNQSETALEDVDVASCSVSAERPSSKYLKKSGHVFTLHSWDSAASARPIENDEWLAFLQRNMEEIMDGQLECVRNHNLVSVVVAPLRNCHASCRVLERVASMLALPFVVDGPSAKDIDQIKQVYLEMKVIPNLLYASKILARRRGYDSEASSPSVLPGDGSELLLRPVSELSADELQALENIYLLICHLVHLCEDFLIQFCDAAAFLNIATLMQQFLLLGRRKVRIATDILAILNLVLREQPENSDVVEQIVLGSDSPGATSVDLNRLLSHPSAVVKSRTCQLIRQLSLCSLRPLQAAWSPHLEQLIHTLLSDSVPSVRLAAEDAYCSVRGFLDGKTG